MSRSVTLRSWTHRCSFSLCVELFFNLCFIRNWLLEAGKQETLSLSTHHLWLSSRGWNLLERRVSNVLSGLKMFLVQNAANLFPFFSTDEASTCLTVTEVKSSPASLHTSVWCLKTNWTKRARFKTGLDSVLFCLFSYWQQISTNNVLVCCSIHLPVAFSSKISKKNTLELQRFIHLQQFFQSMNRWSHFGDALFKGLWFPGRLQSIRQVFKCAIKDFQPH